MRPGAGGPRAAARRSVDAPPCSTYFGESREPVPRGQGPEGPFAPCGYTRRSTRARTARGPRGQGQRRARRHRGSPTPTRRRRSSRTPIRSPSATASAFKGRAVQAEPAEEPVPVRLRRHGQRRRLRETGRTARRPSTSRRHAMAPGANVLYVAARACSTPASWRRSNTIIERRRRTSSPTRGATSARPCRPMSRVLQHDVRAGRPGGHRRLLLRRRRQRREPSTTRTPTRAASPASTSRPPIHWVTAVGGTSLGVDKNNGYRFGGLATASNPRRRRHRGDPPFPGVSVRRSRRRQLVFAEPFYQPASCRTRSPTAIAPPNIAMDGDRHGHARRRRRRSPTGA